MKVVRLKQMAKTLVYLEEKGFADFDALAYATTDAGPALRIFSS